MALGKHRVHCPQRRMQNAQLGALSQGTEVNLVGFWFLLLLQLRGGSWSSPARFGAAPGWEARIGLGVKAKLELLGGKEPSLGLGNSMGLIWKSLVGKIKYGKSRNHCSCSAFLTVIFFWFRQFNILFLFFFP